MSAATNTFRRIAKSKKLKKYASLCDNESIDQEYKRVQRGRSAEQLKKLNSETRLKKDLSLQEDYDDEVLFPYDASRRLTQQVEVLLDENSQLRRSLVEAEARLQGVVAKCPPGMGSHGRASDLAASKIVELSKRVRELTADLEVARMRCRNYEMSSLTAAQPEAPEQKEAEEDSKSQQEEIKELTDKLSSANLKVCEYRNQCQQLRHELKIAHKALVNEVGEGVSVSTIVSGGGSGGWRGRAQQIQTLQQKLNELSEKSSNPDLVEKEAKRVVSAVRLQEKELRGEHEREVAGLREQLEEKHKKLEAGKARCRVLENSLAELRGRLSSLLDKSTHDDQLISALTAQLSQASDMSQERNTSSRLEQQARALEQQLSEEKSKLTYLQEALLDKDKELLALEKKLTERHKEIDLEAIDKSRSASTEPTHNNNCALEPVGVAAEAERVRLLELLAVTNRRLEHERHLATQAQDVLRRERHKAARLETKLARQELERVSGSGRSYQNTSPHKHSEAAHEELKCKVELLEEEVLYLRARLTNVEQEKQDDLRAYTDMLEDTRHTFMDAVKSFTSYHPL